MEPRVTRVEHIAIAVKDLEQALAFYTDVLGLEVVHRQTVPEQGVKVAFVEVGGVKVELMEPIDDRSYVARQLEKHGPGLAHVCFETDDLDALTEELTRRDLVLLTPEPVLGSDGRRVIFLHPKDNSGTMTEFCERGAP